jgi:hypothetical protein
LSYSITNPEGEHSKMISSSGFGQSTRSSALNNSAITKFGSELGSSKRCNPNDIVTIKNRDTNWGGGNGNGTKGINFGTSSYRR